MDSYYLIVLLDLTLAITFLFVLLRMRYGILKDKPLPMEMYLIEFLASFFTCRVLIHDYHYW